VKNGRKLAENPYRERPYYHSYRFHFLPSLCSILRLRSINISEVTSISSTLSGLAKICTLGMHAFLQCWTIFKLCLSLWPFFLSDILRMENINYVHSRSERLGTANMRLPLYLYHSHPMTISERRGRLPVSLSFMGVLEWQDSGSALRTDGSCTTKFTSYWRHIHGPEECSYRSTSQSSFGKTTCATLLLFVIECTLHPSLPSWQYKRQA